MFFVFFFMFYFWEASKKVLVVMIGFLIFNFFIRMGFFDFFNSFFQSFIFLKNNFFLFSKGVSTRPRIPVKNWIFEGRLFWCPNLGEENFNFFLISSPLGFFLLKTQDDLSFDKGTNLKISVIRSRFNKLSLNGKVINVDYFNKLVDYCLPGVPKIMKFGLGFEGYEVLKSENFFFYLGRERYFSFWCHYFIMPSSGEIYFLLSKSSLQFLNKNYDFYSINGVFIFKGKSNKFLWVEGYKIEIFYFGEEENFWKKKII